MKKPTKTVKTPTPAPKKAAPAPALKAAPAAAPKKTAAKAPAPVKKASAAVTAVKPKTVVTTISAKIDIGFGNTLFLRGVGPGLSWDKGIPLANIDEDVWTVALPESARPVTFKFLVNDLTWSTGEDYVVESGSISLVTPSF